MKNKKINLPNGCWCSRPKICPKSAYDKKASTEKDWCIQYRFYDPKVLDKSGKIKPHAEQVKGMNEEKDPAERLAVCEELIDNEIRQLKAGFNPQKKRFVTELEDSFEVNPYTPFIKALWTAYKEIDGVAGTLIDIKSVINGVEKAARSLGFDTIPVGQVTRKYIYAILKRCRELNSRFSDNRYNMYRAYLMKLFKQLRRMEAVEINPMHDIDVIKVTRKIRKTLTKEQRIAIDKKMKAERYNFWRAIQLFFHSGARETEFMQVQAKHVDLVNQLCRYTVLKGGQPYEVDRPIKNQTLQLYRELLQQCTGPDDFLFSKFLQPGNDSIRPDQLGRRWTKYVQAPEKKGGMGINVTFYQLKHSNYTETTDILNKKFNPVKADELMIEHTGHKSTAMAVVYDMNRGSRHHDVLINIDNSFGELGG